MGGQERAQGVKERGKRGGAKEEGWGGPRRPPHRRVSLPHAHGEGLQSCQEVQRSATLLVTTSPSSTLPFTQFGKPESPQCSFFERFGFGGGVLCFSVLVSGFFFLL